MQHTIIGLGWLGQSLAKHLNHQGHDVIGTVRQAAKQERLLNSDIQSYLYDCYQPIPPALATTLFRQRNLIINIAAGRRNLNIQLYVNAIKSLVDTAIVNSCNKIIFISTTSVFSDGAGEVTNQTTPNPHSTSGQAHHQIEKYLLSEYEQSTVLRLAGLVGPNPDGGFRHPIHSLIKRSPLSNAKDPVNLVHKYDVISAVEKILKQNHIGRSFNLCSHEHPKREDYYKWCSRQLDLLHPSFKESEGEKTKTKWINADDTLHALKLSLAYPSPYDMLPELLNSKPREM